MTNAPSAKKQKTANGANAKQTYEEEEQLNAKTYRKIYEEILADETLEEKEKRFWRESGWDQALEARHHPLVLDDPKEFIQQLALGNHMEEVVVLRDGLRKLDLMQSLPADLLESTRDSTTVLQCLRQLEPDVLETWDGRVYNLDNASERELLKDEGVESILEARQLLEKSTKKMERLYVAELRLSRQHKRQYAVDSEMTRTLLARSVQNQMGDMRKFPIYWDRYNEGMFLGQKYTGSPLHMDQCLWSNVGRNWAGWKLMALWPQNDKDILTKYYRKLFAPPLSPDQVTALRSAMKIVLVRPGDVFLFTGSCPHMALCASEAISLTSYESFVNLNRAHVEIFAQSNNKAVHPHDFHMSRRTLDDIREEVGERVNELLDDDQLALHKEASKLLVDTAEYLRRMDPLFRNEIRPSHRIKASACAQGYSYRKVLVTHPDGRKLVLENVSIATLRQQLKEVYGPNAVLQYWEEDFGEFCDLTDDNTLPPLPRLTVRV